MYMPIRLRMSREDELIAPQVPVAERVRRLPEAVLLTAGYYASRAPLISELLRRHA
jgi:hypothetical protein